MVKDWPKYLREFRAKHDLSQKDLADKLMVSHRLVENWEGGINTPPPYLKNALRTIDGHAKAATRRRQERAEQ